MYNATETKEKCYINFSRWPHPLILPGDLQCRLSDHEAQYFEEFQLHARSHHAGPKGFVKTSGECMESVQEDDSRGRRKQRERQQAAQEWRQGINESERQISSLLRRFARKVDRRAAKIEPQTRPGNPRARWGANRLLARAQNPPSSEGGDGSRSGPHGGSQEERERARAAFVEALAVEAEGAPKQVLATFMANSDRLLWSVQGERGTLSWRNPSSAAQGEGGDGVQRARSAQERGRERGTAGRRARGKGRETSNRPDAECERGRDGGGRRSEDRADLVSGEAVARPAVCTAEVMERLRIMAKTSVVAVRMLANAERNRQLSRGGAAP